MINTACIIALSIIELYLIYIWFVKDSRMLAIVVRNIKHGSITPFNPENKAIGEMSYGDYCNPFMKITNQKDANQYLSKALAYDRLCFPNKPVHKLIYEQVHNILYIAHKHDKETEKRVKALLNDSL